MADFIVRLAPSLMFAWDKPATAALDQMIAERDAKREATE